MTNTKSFNSGMGDNPLDKENIPINASEETTRLKSTIKHLKFQLEQKTSEVDILKVRVESLENQIVQILACSDPEKAQMIEQIKKDILTYDPTYFKHFIEHCAFSSAWNEANKKV